LKPYVELIKSKIKGFLLIIIKQYENIIVYTRKCYLEGKNIIIERNFKLKEIFIPTENYKEYKKIIEEIIDRDNEILILK